VLKVSEKGLSEIDEKEQKSDCDTKLQSQFQELFGSFVKNYVENARY